MKELILSAIVVVGTAFVLIWKRYGTRDARREKLHEELTEIIEEIETMEKFDIPLDDFNYARYHRLTNRRMQINERIGRYRR